MSSGIDGASYITATGTATSTSVTSTGTATGGTGTPIGSTTTGTTTIPPRFPQLTLISHPASRGVEFLASCPFQPPSILPTSSSTSESAIYFFVSSDLVSHRIMQSSFNVSTFLVARRTYGIFSSFDKNAAAEIASMISMNKMSILAPSECRWSFGSSAWYVCQSK